MNCILCSAVIFTFTSENTSYECFREVCVNKILNLKYFMIVEVLTDNSSYFQPSVLLVFCPKLSMSTFFVVQIFSIVVISNVFKYVRDLCLFMYLSCKGFSKGIFCHI